MLTADMTYICDAEIGMTRQNPHWRACRAPAVIRRKTNYGTVLHFCRKHAHHATSPRSSYYIPAPGSEAETITP